MWEGRGEIMERGDVIGRGRREVTGKEGESLWKGEGRSYGIEVGGEIMHSLVNIMGRIGAGDVIKGWRGKIMVREAVEWSGEIMKGWGRGSERREKREIREGREEGGERRGQFVEG